MFKKLREACVAQMEKEHIEEEIERLQQIIIEYDKASRAAANANMSENRLAREAVGEAQAIEDSLRASGLEDEAKVVETMKDAFAISTDTPIDPAKLHKQAIDAHVLAVTLRAKGGQREVAENVKRLAGRFDAAAKAHLDADAESAGNVVSKCLTAASVAGLRMEKILEDGELDDLEFLTLTLTLIGGWRTR